MPASNFKYIPQHEKKTKREGERMGREGEEKIG